MYPTSVHPLHLQNQKTSEGIKRYRSVTDVYRNTGRRGLNRGEGVWRRRVENAATQH
ncbi:MAG: hypothetical protein HC936_08310 [Leptolyngbyaceae cyanobacterium SU_3_3]|nr:hypothetical protein [Leptolyngbyaceae cyanobacterium SU_3_3]NJR52605.1 hypothetical protein [Leptolyngbyaceae cyanobacterium CSU_1_3]